MATPTPTSAHGAAAARTAERSQDQRRVVELSALVQPVVSLCFADKLSVTTAAPGLMLQATGESSGNICRSGLIQRGRSQRRRSGSAGPNLNDAALSPQVRASARAYGRPFYSAGHPVGDRRRSDAELRRERNLGDHQDRCFPTRSALFEIMVVVGDLKDCQKAFWIAFIKSLMKTDISLVQAYGRRGWFNLPLTSGWKIRTKSSPLSA